jgi:SpoVK/Ycf46/Vps4 family AAA+-type ATPase
MTKYYVYCLKNKGELVYIGSTTKIIDMLKTHKRDKEFDEVVYCELPDKETMLEVEAFGISKKNPLLNKDKPNFSIKELPEFIKWKCADLNFLRHDDVDWDYGFEVDASWGYYSNAMDELGIPIELATTGLCLKQIDRQIVAVFDGSGKQLIDFIEGQGYADVDSYVKEYFQTHGKISIESYEKSMNQFN